MSLALALVLVALLVPLVGYLQNTSCSLLKWMFLFVTIQLIHSIHGNTQTGYESEHVN